MNVLPGIIQEVRSEGHLSLVKIKVGDELFSSIVIDTAQTVPYLITGKAVDLLFKENEVVIAKSFSGQISMQNKFLCTIQSIEKGKLLSKLILNYYQYTITSLITTNAIEQLQCIVGDEVTAMVKTNEISLSPHD
jgi:molybdate transport system regulatory protein